MAGEDLGDAGPAQAAWPVCSRAPQDALADLTVLLLLAAVLTVVIKSFAVEAFWIPSGSMQDTLRVGDRVLVNKLVYRVRGIDRGDVIVFSGRAPGIRRRGHHPGRCPRPCAGAPATGMASSGTDYVKRVIGLPGDRVSCCDALGRITVNGVPLNERSYLYPGDQPSAQRFSLTVPPGRLWVMGDHRLNSSDSRYHGDDPGERDDPGAGRDRAGVPGRVASGQFREVPIPATFAQRGLAALPRRGLTPLPMAVGRPGWCRLGGRAAGRPHTFRQTGVRLGTMNDDRGIGEPASTGSPGVELPGHDGDGAVGAEPEIPRGTGTMTPPPRCDATAQSGDTGGQAAAPGGPARAQASAGGPAGRRPGARPGCADLVPARARLVRGTG